jgi:AcrR family transcriptional regulator
VEHSQYLTRQELYELIWARSLNLLAAEFGISANGLAKICDRMLVPRPGRGYFSRSAQNRSPQRPPLPPAPKGCDDQIIISPRRAQSRRPRTRLAWTDRRDQIAQTAAKLITSEGINATTLKRVALELGISEAMVYNYYPSQIELLTYIARREQVEMAELQAAEIARQADYLDRVRASMAAYLDYVEQNGSLLQVLLSRPEVRNVLRQEHQARRAWSAVLAASKMTDSLDVPESLAFFGTQILRAIGVRTGVLLAIRRIDRVTAGRLSRTLMDGARRSLVDLAQSCEEAPRPAGPLPAPRFRQRPSRVRSPAQRLDQGG